MAELTTHKKGDKMPQVKVSSVTVSHVWDDESTDDFIITAGNFEDTGDYVSVRNDGDTIFFRIESWEEIRDQIDGLFGNMGDSEADE